MGTSPLKITDNDILIRHLLRKVINFMKMGKSIGITYNGDSSFCLVGMNDRHFAFT